MSKLEEIEIRLHEAHDRIDSANAKLRRNPCPIERDVAEFASTVNAAMDDIMVEIKKLNELDEE